MCSPSSPPSPSPLPPPPPCKLQSSVGTAGVPLPGPDRSGHCRTSSASDRSQWAVPDFSCELQIAVGTAGLQRDLPAPDRSFSHELQILVGTARLQERLPNLSGHCRTSTMSPEPSGDCRTLTASSRSQCSLPDLNRESQNAVGTAGPQPRVPDPSGHSRASTASCMSPVVCESVVSSCHGLSVVLSVVSVTLMALSTLRAPKRARRGGVPTPSGMHNNLGMGMNPLMMMLNPMANPMAAMMGQSMNPMAAMMGQGGMNPGHQVVPMEDEVAETESEAEGAGGGSRTGQSQSSGHRLSMTSQSSGSQALESQGAAATPGPMEPDVPIYPVVRPDDPAQEEFNARRQAENFISRSVTYIKNIPRQHLAVCMEFINPRLDMSFTSECSTNGLLALLWLHCRIKPCIRVLSDLRCWDLCSDP
eukprot:s1285_g8.t1